MRRIDEHRGDWKEWRRLRAWELVQQGWNQKEIAEALGVTEGAVNQWMKRGREQRVEGLRGKTDRRAVKAASGTVGAGGRST